jgi:hypothetical protein
VPNAGAAVADAGGAAAAAAASVKTMLTGSFWPVTFSTMPWTQMRLSSHWDLGTFWFGWNANVTPAALASMLKACATTRL